MPGIIAASSLVPSFLTTAGGRAQGALAGDSQNCREPVRTAPAWWVGHGSRTPSSVHYRRADFGPTQERAKTRPAPRGKPARAACALQPDSWRLTATSVPVEPLTLVPFAASPYNDS